MPIMRHALLTDPDDAQARAQDGQFMFGDSLLAAPVVAPGQTTKEVYAPRGVWLDFNKAVRYVEGSGAYVPLGKGKVLTGRRTYKLDAPLERLPMLIKAGSVLPLLPADVDTLADYGTGVVHLKDRRKAMTLLAFPRGTSTSRFNTRGVVKSVESHRRWKLTIRSDRARTFTVRATTWSLRKPFRPRSVRLGKRRLRFSYRGGVLTFKAKTKRGTVSVTG
jgi:alpha-glucosidase (family GH31 glycosyl hydrolase)